MKKLLLLFLCFLLSFLFSCGRPPEPPKPEPDTTKIEKLNFVRLESVIINWSYRESERRTLISLREDNTVTFYIDIPRDEDFSKYFVKLSDNTICSLGNDGFLPLKKGRNTVSVKGKAEGHTLLKIYGVNESGREVLISGFEDDDDDDYIGNEELEIIVYPKNYTEEKIKSVIINDTDTAGMKKDVLSVTFGDSEFKIPLPESFSLEDAEAGYVAYRSKVRNQNPCGSCSYFTAVGLLEIETKRQLTEDSGFVFSKYDIDLSEAELLMKRKDRNIGSSSKKNLTSMCDSGWIIPLEEYNSYDKLYDALKNNNCRWSDFNAVNSSWGLKIKNAPSWIADKGSNVDFETDEIEIRVKSLLYFYKKAVAVSVAWPDQDKDPTDVLEEGNERGEIDHEVYIIGWKDNYRGKDGKEYGKVWVARNHWGEMGNLSPTFRMKMGNTAGASYYTYISDVAIENYERFKSKIEKEWQDSSILENGKRRGRSAKIISNSSEKGDYVGYELVEKIGDFNVIRNPKEAFPNVSFIPNVPASQTLKNVDLYRVKFKVSRKGINYKVYFPKAIGIAGLKHNPFFRYCEITGEDDNYIYFSTYTFRIGEVYDSNGKIVEDVRWIPGKPQDCAIGYTYEPEN